MSQAATDRLKAALADRYIIERELGAGGMATVYLARDLRHEREVAIKVLKPELAAVLGADRFVQEIKTTAALQHPHILPLFDSGTLDGFLFYVMPYVEGETLRSKLDRERQLGVSEAVKIAVDVADALDYAHRHGVIHRDIKPENILLHDGRPTVADFGIALAVSAAAGGRMTETGLSLGTPHYMSPEQATAEREITARSDVYSLGAVLYEMLTGNPPHTGATAQQIIMKIVTEDAQPVTTHRKAVPPNVAAAVATALEKLPADRFETARQFANALENPAYGAGTVATTESDCASASRGPAAWIRSRLSWAALGLAAAGVAFGLVARRELSRNAHSHPSFEQKTFQPEAIFSARFAADGKTIVFSSTGPSGLVAHLYVIRPDYPEAQPIGNDSTHLLAISRDDQLAVLTGATYAGHRVFSGTLGTVPLSGGTPRPVLADVSDADWSPRGDTLAVIHATDSGSRLEYPIGTVLAESQGYISDIRISPSGGEVAYFDHPTHGDDRGTVVIIDRKRRILARSPEFESLEGVAWDRAGKRILFSAAHEGGSQGMAVTSMDLKGVVATELTSADGLTLQDASSESHWLVTEDIQPNLVFFHAAGATQDENSGWLNYSWRPLLSHDGKELVFGQFSVAAGSNYAVMVRRTDGTPAILLGEGYPTAILPGGNSVLAQVPSVPPRSMRYPIGTGEPTPLGPANLPFQSLEPLGFTSDHKNYVGCGNRIHERPGCYLIGLTGKPITPITTLRSRNAILSDDGNWLAAQSDHGFQLFSTHGLPPRALSALTAGDILVRWSPDARAIWVARRTDLTFHVDRVDVQTGQRTPITTIAPKDPTGVSAISSITLADDPRVYAYSETRYTSSLFVVTGVH